MIVQDHIAPNWDEVTEYIKANEVTHLSISDIDIQACIFTDMRITHLELWKLLNKPDLSNFKSETVKMLSLKGMWPIDLKGLRDNTTITELRLDNQTYKTVRETNNTVICGNHAVQLAIQAESTRCTPDNRSRADSQSNILRTVRLAGAVAGPN